MVALECFADTDVTTALSPILIVDDSKAQRRLVSRTLEKWGYETVEAESGRDALELCSARHFDIIISDWIMPGMSGVDFCRTFRAQSTRPTYFILLTAQTEREILAAGLDSGADDFLSKPFNAVELRARLGAGTRVVQAQTTLAARNQALSETLEELSDAYAAIERDLNGARTFQEGLVPERFVSFEHMDVSLLLQSSGHVGGDLVGYFPVGEKHIVLFSVDVSGHGVASALMTARIAGYFSTGAPDRNIALRKVGETYALVPLVEVCRRLNEILLMDAESDQYFTMSIASVHLDTGAVELCHAGHPSPVVQRANGDIEFRQLWSTPIGLIENAEFVTTELALQRGDRLMIYSDGVTECPDPQNILLDEDGLASILKRLKDQTGLQMTDGLLQELARFRNGSDFPDDISAVLVEAR